MLEADTAGDAEPGKNTELEAEADSAAALDETGAAALDETGAELLDPAKDAEGEASSLVTAGSGAVLVLQEMNRMTVAK